MNEHHGHGQDHGHHGHSGPAAAEAAMTVRDPVCGMTVDPARMPHHAEHAGAAYHFCSAGCRAKFVAEPGRYVQWRDPVKETTPAALAGLAGSGPRRRWRRAGC